MNYPTGITYHTVQTYGESGYRFCLGASIVCWRGMLVCGYLQCTEKENDSSARFVCKYSFDQGATWSPLHVIAEATEACGRSHGVFYNDGETLWAYCPRAAFGRGTPEDLHPAMQTESYRLNPETLEWQYAGVALPAPFWPLCEPIRLESGALLMAGAGPVFREKYCGSAVALSGGDPLKWELIEIPNPDHIPIWGETTVRREGNGWKAFVRTYEDYAAVSTGSVDGRHWLPLTRSDIPAVHSKLYAGTLKSGVPYLIRNIDPTGCDHRNTLVISFGEAAPLCIRSGFLKKPHHFGAQWSYPYAIEEQNRLYVVYTLHKEEIELAVIPV